MFVNSRFRSSSHKFHSSLSFINSLFIYLLFISCIFIPLFFFLSHPFFSFSSSFSSSSLNFSCCLKTKYSGLLETPIKSNDTQTTIDLKNLYMSCMNERLIERKGIKPLIKLLKEELIEWPLLQSSSSNLTTINGSSSNVIDENKNSTDEWVILLGKLRKYNNNILINVWIGPDARNSSANTIHVSESSFSTSLSIDLTSLFSLSLSHSLYLEFCFHCSPFDSS